LSSMANGEVLTETHGDDRPHVLVGNDWLQALFAQRHKKDTGIGGIITEQEFPPRVAGSPNYDFRGTVHFGFMHLANQRWDDMGILEVVAIFEAEKIRGHRREKFGAVLPVI